MARQGEVTVTVNRPPDAVFAAITDVHSLPKWNERITSVDTGPDRLGPGDEWVVNMLVLGRKFRSRSRVLDVDHEARRFEYRSAPDDDNPSHTVWTWSVAPAEGGAAVTLQWDMKPRTPMRHFAALIRSRMIPDEARASITALEDQC